ncbi:MAG: hypothetical protein ACAH17_03425 [Candidatus Paceibacterota bacterium]
MRKRTYLLWKKILTRLAFTAVVVGAFYIYFFTGTFTIQHYKLLGIPEEYTLDLKRNMIELADQKLFKILPGNRVLSYHDDAIREVIMDTLPNTKNISIYPTGLHTLKVALTSYTPLFSVSDEYAIASDATVYKEIVSLSDFPRLEIATTTQVSPSTLTAIAKLSEKIDAVLWKIHAVTIDEYGDIKLYNEGRKSYIAIASGSDETKVWSNILSAIDTDPLKKNLATNPSALEYIDARFGNKVFYKFTNASTPSIIPPYATSTATTTVH